MRDLPVRGSGHAVGWGQPGDRHYWSERPAYELHHARCRRPCLRRDGREGALSGNGLGPLPGHPGGQHRLRHRTPTLGGPGYGHGQRNRRRERPEPPLRGALRGKNGGQVAFIPFQPGTGTNDQRKEGFTTGLPDHPELELVAEQSSQSDYVLGLQVTENILAANAGLDAIFAANEPGVLGAVEALRRPGYDGEIVVVGWDGSPAEVDALREGVINALVVQNPFQMGYQGVDAVIRKIRYGEDTGSQDTGVTLVTGENVDDPEAQAVLNPSCDNPPT